MIGKRAPTSRAKLFAAPTDESARLALEKSAQIALAEGWHGQDRQSQIGNRLARVVAFAQSNRVDRSRCAAPPAAQARGGRSEEIPSSSLAAADVAVLATGRGTRDEKLAPIVRATNNGRRRKFPPESHACCRSARPCDRRCERDRADARCRGNSLPAFARPEHSATTHRRSQDRRAAARRGRRFSVNRGA